MTSHFAEVTEIAGQKVSREQLDRTCHRYHWAAKLCGGKDVLEVACGSGPGLRTLEAVSRKVVAGDISPGLVEMARSHSGSNVDLHVFDASSMPFPQETFDVVIIFEAIYYLPSFESFLEEAKRVLRKGGSLLISTANKDLFDFTPSPYSSDYFGTKELLEALEKSGFEANLYGYHSVDEVSNRQKLLRPIKFLASHMNLVPRTMKGKEWLKRVFFGSLVTMPTSIESVDFSFQKPTKINNSEIDRAHKIIYCVASINQNDL
jgi:ubiquinone/menaquinone biosynthesis C-methylase UbiE